MLSNATTFRRTAAGLALIAAPLLFLIGDIVSPAWSDDNAEYFAEVAESPSAQSATGVVYTIGMALMVAGAIGIVNCIRGRGVTLANIALPLAVLGLGVFPVLTGTAIVDAFATEAITSADYVALIEAGEDSVGFIVILAIALLGSLLSLLLLAIAVGRSGLAPWWVAGLLIIATALLIASGGSQALAIGTSALQLVGFGYLGVRLLGMSDTEWVNPPHDWREDTTPAPAHGG